MAHRIRLVSQLFADGRPDAALATAEEFVMEAPDDPLGYFLLADCHARLGSGRVAVELIRQARALGGSVPDGLSDAFLQTCAVTPFDFDYSEILCRPSPWLGHWSAGREPSPLHDRLIKATLDLHRQAWEAGEIAAPMRADAYGPAGEAEPSLPRLTVLVAMLERVGLDPAFIESDVRPNFVGSARGVGLDAHAFSTDTMTYETNLVGLDDTEIKRARDELEATIARLRPALVVTDGNYIPTGRGMGVEDWNALKARFGFRMAVVIPDCYDIPERNDDKLAYWSGCADVLSVFHPYSRAVTAFPDPARLLVCPSFPFDETRFAVEGVAKSRELFFVGTVSRQRQALVNAAGAAGMSGWCQLHNRKRDQAPSYEEYIQGLLSSRLSLNNGRVAPNSYIVTGRTAESMLAGSLLLEDVGSPLDEYYVPWVHYVPFSSLHELIVLLRFFQSHEEERARIAEAARAQWRRHYSNRRHWAALLRKAGLG
ncbi:hypothetical protein A6A04_02400 [Paramagnetospirillum marisnigri]|uniref:Spore protein YkvP/CgeB glycosyl transferase-like domain-containing protein n=1 Tax=Paramagnetospirillum marisnigri TaxID=1285242 RepID=A0A178MNB9_9PROT|nr:glycosyltransferase [Paramagnetospirillum marisnigri]OAN50272.1 hypothetical protein A6A04_02400 [Paramagnetospirillum marisnigri]